MIYGKSSFIWSASFISLLGLASSARGAVCGCDAIAPNNLKAALPNPGAAGQISRVLDDSKGLWLDNGANQWSQIGGVTNVKDFGAVGDGNATDDTAAIQAAINSLPMGGRLYFPATTSAANPGGAYVITQTLAITNVAGLTIIGSSRGGTVIQWGSTNHHPPAGIPMIRIKNGYHVTIESMAIFGNPAFQPSAIIESQLATDQPPPNGLLSSQNHFEDLVLGGMSANMATKGIVYDKTPMSLDNANDDGSFHRVEIQNTVVASVSFELAQSKANTFEDCRFGTSQRGVATSLGAGGIGGSFRWYGGTVTNNSVADFDIGGPNDVVLISGANSESSGRLLQIGGPSATPAEVLIEGVRWAADNMNHDGRMIIYPQDGTLNVFASVLGEAAPAGVIPVIELNFTRDGTANIIGNMFANQSAFAASPVTQVGLPGAGRVVMLGNIYHDAVGNSAIREDPSVLTGGLAGLVGLSQTTTASNNLRNIVTVTGANNSATYTFPTAEPNSTYFLSVTPSAKTGVPAAGSNRITSMIKNPTGFTINVENAPGVGNTVSFDWVLIR